MVGESMKVRVIEVDRERRRLILSERLALQETRETLKERLLDELQEGSVRTGRVTSLADFGAFVNIEGADGLVHLSEISWDRIQHPNEVLKVGQEVKVKVISVDRDRKRIGLSIRQLQEDPWVQKVSHLKEGMLVEGTITHLTKFGAFARLDEDLEGLIHVSELSEQRVGHPKEVVHEGDVVTLRVIKVDPERRRIGLSLRKVDSPAYADLDWKMALAEEVGKTHEEGDEPEARAEERVEEPVEEVSEAATEEPAAELDEEADVEPATELDEGTTVEPAADLDEGTTAEPVVELDEGTTAEPVAELDEGTTEELDEEVVEERVEEQAEEQAEESNETGSEAEE
jgi:small subunit ribosomal protein S1